eukprot:CCRYP_008557-RB/>CCRYP_008557-RB protein AED:0.07 eAED:0.07 QI:227/1/1/1/0.83/0.71/7/648/1147
MRSSTSRFPENPNEGSHSHPHDEYLSFQSARVHHPHAALHQHQPHQGSPQYQLSSMTLASKPHPFSGAVLTPEHARSITPGAVLSLASALSLQAANSAQSKGVLPPGEQNTNLFTGCGADILSPFLHASNNSNLLFPPSSPPSQSQNTHLLQLLQSSNVFQHVPQTPTTATSISTPSSSHSPAPSISANVNATSLLSMGPSMLSISETLETVGAWRIQYTVWITEAWSILKWSEPSAALFWEMATMYHTLYVASLSAAGGGSGSECRVRLLGMMSQGQASGGGGVVSTPGRGSDIINKAKGMGRGVSNFNTALRGSHNEGGFPQTYIPPILSCGSQSSMGSVKSVVESGGDVGGSGGGIPSSVEGSAVSSAASFTKQQQRVSNASNMKPARHSAKELPVWLISMFLLVHCEDQVFLRCTSAEDERRFSNAEGGGGSPGANSPRSLQHHTRPGEAENSLDFSTMLLHRSLSPRTRLHAGMHQNNAHCASFLLRHLRKFLLLCAVPRNSEACRAIAALAAQHSQSSEDRSLRSCLSTTLEELNIGQIEQRHREEHRKVGLNVQLTLEELDRLNLVLQAPSGGPVEEPPIAIGEHVLKCLAVEEMEARESSGGRSTAASLHRLSLMQNGLIAVGDAERILRKYLEEELATAQQELDGDDHDNSEDVTSKLSKLTLSSRTGTDSDSSRFQPLSPPRSRGFSVAESIATDANTLNDSSSYFKELSYRKLRSTTVLLEPNKDYGGPPSNAHNAETNSVVSLHSQTSSTNPHSSQQDKSQSDSSNECGRLHDLHVADCSDTNFYLLQPFEHATVAACTDCTIVIGAVAGLLHIVDCERTTITAAARRVVVSNSFDVVNYLFTPSPPLLVGDNKGCQFAPYNTYYEGLREDLLATGLAAALRSTIATGETPASPTRGGEGGVASPTAVLPALQCASNKWKGPVDLSKLEVPQLPNISTTSTAEGSPTNSVSPGADERALKSTADLAMQMPILLPASEFEILLVPVESEEARLRRKIMRQAEEEAIHEEEVVGDTAAEETNDTTTVYSNASSLTGDREKGDQASSRSEGPIESDYCRNLADILTLSPFHMPYDYERKAVAKAERVRALQQAMMELNEQQRASLQEELNRGFQEWLVASGNLRQILDLVHLEKRVAT